MHRGWIRGVLSAVVIGGGLGLSGFGSTTLAATAPKQITVGTLYASSGSFATSSMPEYQGLQFWAKTVNAHGGVYVKAYGKKIPIKIVAYNDQSDPGTASTEYAQLITKDKVDLLVSDFGSVLTSAGVTVAEEHHMVFWDVTGTGASFFTPSNKYIVLTSLPTSGVWPTSLANFLKTSGIKSVAVIYATNDFDQSQDQTLVTKLKGSSVKVLMNEGVPTTTTNYTVLIHNAAAEHPQALIEFGYDTNDIPFLQNLKASSFKPKMTFTIFPGQLLSLMEQNVGKAGLENSFTYPTPPLVAYNKQVTYGPTIKQFSANWEKATHSTPNFLNVAGYNVGLILQKTLATSKSLSQLSLRDAAASFSGKIFTMDGLYEINGEGAQTGETLPVAQLQPTKSGLKIVIVYPKSKATGKVHFNP